MTQRDSGSIQKPEMDDRAMWDILSGIFAYPAVLVSHDLGLFSLLAERPRTLPEVCDSLGIALRPAGALLSANAALNLVKLDGGVYTLTKFAKTYLLKDSPTSFCGYLDLMIPLSSLYSVDSLKQAVLSDSPQAYGGEDWVKSHERQAEQARVFTLAMHGHSMGPALAWPDVIDLSQHQLMLDIGGGSGAHSIGATRRWPKLKAVVLDLAPVCDVAKEMIDQHGQNDSISTRVFDYWEEAFPAADVHFYSNNYQGWPPDKCRTLTEKSFKSLIPGGRIIIHEILFNDDKTGPLAAAAFNIVMLLWVTGQQYSGKELAQMLRDGGFINIQVKQTFGYWSVVTGEKPMER